MPELPEVEATRRGLAPHIEGQTVTAIAVYNAELRWPVPANLTELLCGRVVTRITRRGKYLLVHFSHGVLLIHLGMSGALRVITPFEPDAIRRKHDHIVLTFSHGVRLVYHDPRRFGCWLWTTDVQHHPLLSTLGPEPWDDACNADYLYQSTKRRHIAVKQAIMDSHLIVGVGNIYAVEALFRAGIHPLRQANRVSKARYQRLLDCIRSTLQEAIDSGGSTLRDYVNVDGGAGGFQWQHAVYGREGLPCLQCGTVLQGRRLGGRATVFCPHCQR